MIDIDSTVLHIARCFCKAAGTTLEAVRASDKSREVSIVRNALCHYLRENLSLTYRDIGSIVNRNYNTTKDATLSHKKSIREARILLNDVPDWITEANKVRHSLASLLD